MEPGKSTGDGDGATAAESQRSVRSIEYAFSSINCWRCVPEWQSK